MIDLSSVNPEKPGFIESIPVKKIVTVTTILALVLGIILIIGGTVGFMPLLPAVISGGVLLGIFASVGGVQLIRHLTNKKKEDLEIKDLGKIPEKITTTPKISGIQEIKGVKFNAELMKKADAWCKDELEKRRELPPEEEGYLYNNFFAESNAVREGPVGKICSEEYPEAFRLVCEKGGNKRRALGVIVGCYPILIQSLIKRDESIIYSIEDLELDQFFAKIVEADEIKNFSNRFTSNLSEADQMKTLKESILYLITNAGRRESAFTSITAGMYWLFRNYMTLKTGVVNEDQTIDPQSKLEPQEFYTPGTDAYFARQIFNSARETFLSVFSLDDLRRYSGASQIIKIIYEACLVPDNGEDFLEAHRDYEYEGRAVCPMFCN